MEECSETGANEAVTLEATVRSVRGVRRVSVTVQYAAVRALRGLLAPTRGESTWPTGLLFGNVAGGAITIEHASTAPGSGKPIGIFRGQPGGWAALTEADRKKLGIAGVPGGLVLVVRTLTMRPWSATLLAADLEAGADPEILEFPFDEYVLRQGWLLDVAPVQEPVAPQPVARPLRRWAAGAAMLALAGAAVVSWQAQRAGKRAAEAPEPVRIERLGLQALRNGDDVEISWDRFSDAVRRAAVGTLIIRDGPVTRVVAMRPEELRVNRVLFHPLAGTDMQLRLEVVDASGVTQADTVQVAAPDTGEAQVAGVPAPELPKPSPMPEPRQRSTARPAYTAAARPPRIQPVRVELPANRGPIATRRSEPDITPKVRAEMRKAKGAVTVSVQVSINAAGNVDGAVVLSSTGEPSPSGPYIRLASLDAARRWKFRPAAERGRPVPSKTTLVFKF